MKKFFSTGPKSRILPFLLLISYSALGAGEPFETAMTTRLSIPQVYLSRSYNFFTNGGRSKSCDDFLGTYEGSSIKLKIETEGGRAPFTHSLVYNFNESYQNGVDKDKPVVRKLSGRKVSATIALPLLRDEIPYVNQTLLVLTKDANGDTTQSTMTFPVSRKVVLTRSQSEEAQKINCFERYPAYESVASVLSNGSTNISRINITQGIRRLWENRRGQHWGIYLSPLSAAPFIGNLVSMYYNYFRETSKQVTETVDISSEYSLSPGDYFQIYTQPTRYITSYDATMVGPCGERETFENSYMVQWWGFSYHVHPIDPLDKNPIDRNLIGAPIINNCSEEFSDEFRNNGKSDFRRMNS